MGEPKKGKKADDSSLSAMMIEASNGHVLCAGNSDLPFTVANLRFQPSC